MNQQERNYRATVRIIAMAAAMLLCPLAFGAADSQRATTPDSTGPGLSQGSGGAGAHPIDSNHPGTNAGSSGSGKSGAKHGNTKQGGSKSKKTQPDSAASAPAAKP